LQLGEVQTAAELTAENNQTSASADVALGEASDLVAAQKIVTNGQVEQTQIEGNTIDTLGAQQTSVQKAIINNVSNQISNVQQYSKNAGSDYQKIAPLIGEELGQPSSVAATAGANASEASTSASVTKTAIGGITSIAAGLFGTGA
jgi:hypothetical protein